MKEVLNQKDKAEVRQTKTSLAKKLGVSRGTLYYTPKRPRADEKLKEGILEVMKDNPSYGHKRIALELKLNKKRILRIMKRFHLMPKRRRNQKFIKPDDLGKPETKYSNLIENFCPNKPNVVWVGDFTHIRFQDSWVYLATVMDIYSREIIGWHLSVNHTRDLIIEAFLDANERRKITPIYFHSDQGSEYESGEHLNLLLNHGIKISIYSGFKLDLGPTNHYQNLGELFEVVSQTIYYYNNQRIHTKLKTAPVKFRLDREYLFKELGT